MGGKEKYEEGGKCMIVLPNVYGSIILTVKWIYGNLCMRVLNLSCMRVQKNVFFTERFSVWKIKSCLSTCACDMLS